jgi:hypothetical protein
MREFTKQTKCATVIVNALHFPASSSIASADPANVPFHVGREPMVAARLVACPINANIIAVPIALCSVNDLHNIWNYSHSQKLNNI